MKTISNVFDFDKVYKNLCVFFVSLCATISEGTEFFNISEIDIERIKLDTEIVDVSFTITLLFNSGVTKTLVRELLIYYFSYYGWDIVVDHISSVKYRINIRGYYVKEEYDDDDQSSS